MFWGKNTFVSPWDALDDWPYTAYGVSGTLDGVKGLHDGLGGGKEPKRGRGYILLIFYFPELSEFNLFNSINQPIKKETHCLYQPCR